MPVAWRIVKQQHATAAFDGEGARRYGGRWNSVGVPIVYTAGSVALAALELLVHLERSALLEAYVRFRVEIPTAAVEELPTAELPKEWRRFPAPPELQILGDRWVEEGRSAALRVPSVVVDGEVNYLLSPGHSDFSTIEIGEPEPFRWDARLGG